jgi:hypothetical protein
MCRSAGGTVAGKDCTQDVSTLAGRVKSAQSRRRKPVRGLKRIVILIFILLFIVGLAIWFRLLSLPSKVDPSLISSAPQRIRVATTDPHAEMQLTALIRWNTNPPLETLLITVKGPKVTPSTRVIITSSSPGGGGGGAKPTTSAFFRPGIVRAGANPSEILDSHVYVCSTTVGALRHLTFRFEHAGSYIGSFNLPQFAQDEIGTFFTHLPSLAHNESRDYPLPIFISERLLSDKPTIAADLLFLPRAKSGHITPIGRSVSDYDVPAGSGPHLLFWQPKVSTTEILYDVEDELADAHIDSQMPADGYLQDGALIWDSAGSLEPMLRATKNDRVEWENRWNFYSGIAFGVAAGAGIAVVQELPKIVPMSFRRRRR